MHSVRRCELGSRRIDRWQHDRQPVKQRRAKCDALSWTLLGLADRHSPERLEAACRRAIEAGDPTYRTVKGIIVAGAEAAPAPEPVGSDTPALLHGPEALVGAGVES